MPNNKPKTSKNKAFQNSSDIFSGNVSLDVFLRDYWQKKPLLIRNAFTDITSPISEEELAGMACEEGINARLIVEKGGETPWSVKYGPIDEHDFSLLPKSHWTLLVNDVEKYVPRAKELFDQFRFIPDWRKDDLMISYAVDGGSVGPHLDAYDVFLIQLKGQRNWKISYQHSNHFIENIELKILSEFKADEEWTLDPGDMLYLPPNLAHYGVAKGSCMTASVGFRAPSLRAMTSEFAEYIASQTSDQLRYGDSNIKRQTNPAEITSSSLNTVKDLLKQQFLIDDLQLKKWFGEYMTDSRSCEPTAEEENHKIADFNILKKSLEKAPTIQQSPESRFLYTVDNGESLLFVDGKTYYCSKEFSELICRNHSTSTDEIIDVITSQHEQDILLDLYNRGCISWS